MPKAAGTPRTVVSSSDGERRLPAQPGGRQRQVVERGTVVVVRVVPVLAGFEQRAELDRLVRLVVVHGPRVEPCEAERQACRQRERNQDAEDRLAHLADVAVPYTSTST